MKRLMITKNSVVETQNPAKNHESQPVKWNHFVVIKDQFCGYFCWKTHKSFLKNYVEPGQTKSVEFFQHWNQQVTSCPRPQCLADQIQVQKPIQVVVTDQCLITLRIESCIISIDSNITHNIIRKVIDVW